jgi:hypothetical protein
VEKMKRCIKTSFLVLSVLLIVGLSSTASAYETTTLHTYGEYTGVYQELWVDVYILGDSASISIQFTAYADNELDAERFVYIIQVFEHNTGDRYIVSEDLIKLTYVAKDDYRAICYATADGLGLNQWVSVKVIRGCVMDGLVVAGDTIAITLVTIPNSIALIRR